MLDRPVGTTESSLTTSRGRSQTRTPDGSERTGLSGAAILAILRRRRIVLLVPMLLAPLLAWLAITQLTPLYTATGSLLYDPTEYQLQELQSILRADPITEAVMATQAEILHGMPVAEQVAARLNLHADPEFNASLRSPSLVERLFGIVRRIFGPARTQTVEVAGPAPDPVRTATLQAVQDALVVTPLKTSHVLQVSFTAREPVLAAAAVNIAMDVYVKSQLGAKYRAVSRARDWLQQRAAELRDEVRKQEDAIAQYRAHKGLVEGMHARLNTEQISLLTENLTHARNGLAEAEGRLDAASGRAGAAAQAAIAPSVVQLRARQNDLAAQLQAMLGRLGSNHPDVKALRAELAGADQAVAAEMARVVAAIAADVRAGREKVTALEQSLRDGQSQVEQDSEAQIPLNAMQRDVDASRGLLQVVLERLQETSQRSAIEAPDAHEISLALPPGRPSFPRTGTWLAASAAFGVLLGLLLVYLSELADNTFRSGEDVRIVLGLPCFALIPRIPRRLLGTLPIEDYAAPNRSRPSPSSCGPCARACPRCATGLASSRSPRRGRRKARPRQPTPWAGLPR
jgi:succinoglycan biosynthesis transport protein ExoP